MPITFSIDDHVAVFTTIGHVDFETGLASIRDGLQVLAEQSGVPVILFDVQQSEKARSSDEIRTIVDAICDETPGAHIAVLAASDLHYGIARMFGSYAEGAGLNAMAFRDRQEAWQWCLKQRAGFREHRVLIASPSESNESDSIAGTGSDNAHKMEDVP